VRLPDGRLSRGVLIGTSRYSDERLPPLQEVSATVEALRARGISAGSAARFARRRVRPRICCSSTSRVTACSAGRGTTSTSRCRTAMLPDRRRVLGPDHKDVLSTTHLLARSLIGLGEFAEAEALLREVVVSRERVLAAEHPHTLRARSDLKTLMDSAADRV
jgi:Tetratricopeptide repeat